MVFLSYLFCAFSNDTSDMYIAAIYQRAAETNKGASRRVGVDPAFLRVDGVVRPAAERGAGVEGDCGERVSPTRFLGQ